MSEVSKHGDLPRTRSRRWIKALVALGVLAVAALMFVRTIRTTLSEPYALPAADLRGWTLAFAEGTGPTDPYLVLRGPTDVPVELSHQLFKRSMESLSSPAVTVVPLLLRGEFERSFAGHMTPEELLATARNAGLGSRPLVPRCLAYRRNSVVGSTRQLFYLLFDMPAFAQFRHVLAGRAGGIGTVAFDPLSLSPATVIATVQSTAEDWFPLAADETADCKAPVNIEAGGL
ncbi:MAG TPA: hypothetical protein VGL59_04405 [Polyangia bacterium]|jgi:hypothetical protein